MSSLRRLAAAAVAGILLVLVPATSATADIGFSPGSVSFPGGGLGGLTSPGISSTTSLSPTDAWGLASSQLSLTQVDVLTGGLQPLSAASASNADTLAVLDLAAQGQLAIDADRIADQARMEADRRRAAADQARMEAAAARAAAQTQVGPDGCPSSVPSGTLRNGAASIGAAELCARSVAQAATPEAAMAIKWAFSKLGVPYACNGMANQMSARLGPNYYDCSSLVSSAYKHGAKLPGIIVGSTRNIMPWDGVPLDRYYEYVAPGEGRPGDLVVQRSCTSSPCAYQHVVMLLADGYQLHTNSCGDVAHVTTFAGTSASNYVVTRRVNPDKAR